MLEFRCDARDRITRSSRRRSSKVIASVARWVFFLGCLLALYYIIVAFDPELLRWLLARLHR